MTKALIDDLENKGRFALRIEGANDNTQALLHTIPGIEQVTRLTDFEFIIWPDPSFDREKLKQAIKDKFNKPN